MEDQTIQEKAKTIVLEQDVEDALKVLRIDIEEFKLSIEVKCTGSDLCDRLREFFINCKGNFLDQERQRAYSILFKKTREWDREEDFMG